MKRCAVLLLVWLTLTAAEPIRLHPDNPHYFLFRGKPAVLITSAEHYAAVLNTAFDYRKYLETLARDGMNLTRVFMGVYRETPADFGILRNTLAPEPDRFISPWERSAAPGALDGGKKFDLKRFNAAYFDRLRDLIALAGKLGIVVEVTLFCTYYRDRLWQLSPLHEANNVNGVGRATHTDVLTMKHPDLVAVQQELVRKIASELRDFDNVIYEICNEPYVAGVSLQWQTLIAKTLADAEAAFPARHLIAQNIANHHQLITNPNPLVSVFHFHYARPPLAVEQNYSLNRAIGLDETGFDGTLDAAYRIQAWDFLIAGGAHYNNLDYSFAVGYEDGSFRVPGDQPGGGSPALRRHLKILRDYFYGFDFIRMKPDRGVIHGGVPEGVSARALSEPGRAYALYLHHGKVMTDYRPRYIVRTSRQSHTVTLQLPPGEYITRWWDPRTGRSAQQEQFTHNGSVRTFTTPVYSEDIALEIRAR
jgi:hypothetical protein